MSEAACCSLTFDEQCLQTLNFRSELEDNNSNDNNNYYYSEIYEILKCWNKEVDKVVILPIVLRALGKKQRP